MTAVPLTDEFSDTQGRLQNYDAYNFAEMQAIAAQKHIDIRRFVQADETTSGGVLLLDTYDMTTLNLKDIGTLAQTIYPTNLGEAWTGTVTNLVTNPSLEVNTVGWSTSGNSYLAFGAVITRDTTTSQVGVASLKVVTSGSQQGPGVTIGALAANTTYTASFYAKGNVGGEVLDVYVSLDSITGGAVAGQTSITITAGWARYSITFTTGAGPYPTPTFVARQLAAGGLTYFLDAIQVAVGATVQPYFDGSTPGYAWTGTAHASTSANIISGKQSDRKNWNGMTLPLTVGTTTSSSVMAPIDINTGFTDTDFISLALPAFPLASITQASSFIDFTSNATGNFTAGPTDSIALSATTIPLVAGDSEWRVLRSALTTVNKSAITGVRFRITATAVDTFRAMALRLLSSAWKYAPVDVDTRYQRLIQTVAPNGSITRAYDQQYNTMWRAASPPGAGDPRPIDISLGALFNTGSMTSTNSFSIYLRELAGLDFLTQVDLDTLPMSTFDGKDQPDIGVGQFLARPEITLDVLTQTLLDPQTQYRIERIDNPLHASWLAMTLQWTSAGLARMIIGNSVNNASSGVTNTLEKSGLVANTNYVLYIDLAENTIRARIYPILDNGQIGVLFMDSTAIQDDSLYKRRKGRIGLSTQFVDGDVYIEGIRTRGSVFAEYRSAPLQSITPVEGCSLFVEGSGAEELVLGIEAGPYGGNLVDDAVRTLTGKSTNVKNTAGIFGQGIRTNKIDFEDFSDYELNFDLFYPLGSAGLLDFYLVGDQNQIIPLSLPSITTGIWQHFKVDFGQIKDFLNGRYRLVIIDSRVGITQGWWIEGVSIKRRTIRWSARAQPRDPWNPGQVRWTPFQNLINEPGSGVLFDTRGNELQIRGQATSSDASINRIKFIPKYASLGRIMWPDQKLPASRPTSKFTYTNVGGGAKTLNFDGTTSSANGQIINYLWSYGDGALGYGPLASHIYSAIGVYTVSLTVTDDTGAQDIASIIASVT